MSFLRQLSQDLSALVAKVSPAVVGIEHPRGQGSGVVLAADGYVLTNAHVAGRGGRLRVRAAGGASLQGELVGADDRTDLAVVRVPSGSLDPLPLADSGTLRVGEMVVAIGNPLGFARSVSLGVVSALYRDLPLPRGGFLEGLIQTDAAVNPGNSGGPLVNAEGAVVGITSAMVPFAHGIGFAVPARTANWVAAVLIQKGEVRRPYLGVLVRAEELSRAASQETGRTRAVRVLKVEPDTPAASSGIEDDDVLLSANDSPILTLDDLQRVLVLSVPHPVELEVRRGELTRRLRIAPQLRSAA